MTQMRTKNLIAVSTALFLQATTDTCIAQNLSSSNSNSALSVARSYEPEINKHYTPLVLPQHAEQRGISLSGSTKLIELAPNSYAMSGGKALIVADEAMSLDTGLAKISAKAHTVLIVFENEDGLRVFNLHDSSRNGVKIQIGKTTVNLEPGVEAAILNKDFPWRDHAVLVSSKVGYRRPKETVLNDKYKLVVLEFSIVDKLKHGKIFTQLAESPNKQDRDLIEKIEKTAAAINTIYRRGGGPQGSFGGGRWNNDRNVGREDYLSHSMRKSVKEANKGVAEKRDDKSEKKDSNNAM